MALPPVTLASSGIRTVTAALLSETFAGANGAAWSGLWTPGYAAGGSATVQNGWGRLTAGGTNNQGMRTTAAMPANLEMSGLFRFNGYCWPKIVLRGGDNMNSDRGYFWQPWHNGDTVTLGRDGSEGAQYSGGATLLSGVDAGVTFSTGQIVKWRFSTVTEAGGVRLRLKLWDTADEPGPWLLNHLDTAAGRILTAGNRAGFINASSSAGGSIDLDNIIINGVS